MVASFVEVFRLPSLVTLELIMLWGRVWTFFRICVQSSSVCMVYNFRLNRRTFNVIYSQELRTLLDAHVFKLRFLVLVPNVRLRRRRLSSLGRSHFKRGFVKSLLKACLVNGLEVGQDVLNFLLLFLVQFKFWLFRQTGPFLMLLI